MPTTETIQSALKAAIQLLHAAGIDTPRLDAEVLLAHILKRDRTWLVAHNRDPLSLADEKRFANAIHRRLHHEPVAHILGEREFYGLMFFVSPAVLVPRPETELLVEAALERLPEHARVMDIGTGSGCIAVSLAVNNPSVQVFAGDISARALTVAKQNIARHHMNARVLPVQMDLLSSVCGKFHAILSNPPYIAPAEQATLPEDVREFDPPMALFSDENGLAHIERILRAADRYLVPGGWLMVEFGASQGAAVLSLAQRLQPQASFSIQKDLAGHDRILVGEF